MTAYKFLEAEEIEVDCIHCDEPFPGRYLLWHFRHSYPSRTIGPHSLLTCKECGFKTVVKWGKKK